MLTYFSVSKQLRLRIFQEQKTWNGLHLLGWTEFRVTYFTKKLNLNHLCLVVAFYFIDINNIFLYFNNLLLIEGTTCKNMSGNKMTRTFFMHKKRDCSVYCVVHFDVFENRVNTFLPSHLINSTNYIDRTELLYSVSCMNIEYRYTISYGNVVFLNAEFC